MSNYAISILELSNTEAKEFFLEEKSYCNFDLPPYFSFENLMKAIDAEVGGRAISGFVHKPQNQIGINYLIYSNKDGKLSWRPLQLIHPLIYISLVNKITEPRNWDKLTNRFKNLFKHSKNIFCLSIPVKSQTKKSNKAEQVLAWWEEIEQKSIELALNYNYLFKTDISDCYSSIYTHSIAWAVESKRTAKKNHRMFLLGNFIDKTIQSSQNGQTNGIPQGSVLMDFVAEILLGYIDRILSYRISAKKITDYKILRYRDDYRIFVQSERDGENILRILSETLLEFGLKLNPNKTTGNKDIITNAIKTDKLAWFPYSSSIKFLSMQKQLILIRNHSLNYPNSGSLVIALSKINKKISKSVKKGKKIKQPKQMISIVTDIAFNNPRCIPVCCAIISQILTKLEAQESLEIAKQVYNNLSNMPNSGFAQIWLQRMLKSYGSHFSYDERLCNLLSSKLSFVWNSDWITHEKIKNIMNTSTIYNSEIFDYLDFVIDSSEFDLFNY